jgi:hypothetical protein
MSVQWNLHPEECKRPYLGLGVSAKRALEAECDKLSRPPSGGGSAIGLAHEVSITVHGGVRRFEVEYEYKRRLRMIHRITVRSLRVAA